MHMPPAENEAALSRLHCSIPLVSVWFKNWTWKSPVASEMEAWLGTSVKGFLDPKKALEGMASFPFIAEVVKLEII